ncbi:MAG: response regulator transcription factor [Pseudomonadota bacterium]
MILIVDERELVRNGYASQFSNEGVACADFARDDFEDWVDSARGDDIEAVQACIIDSALLDALCARSLRQKLGAAVIALADHTSLEQTLALFAGGVDDVVRKPVHAREILARIAVISRRAADKENSFKLDRLQVFFDGRDPEIDGKTFPLPRRERRILEYLASIGNRRASKSQIFSSIYGVFNEDVEENVVESHLSKLRKKLRHTLGYDPIDSKRYLGYRLVAPEKADKTAQKHATATPEMA